jgi:branched-chain amino acid transport system substrate-binding protein
MKCLIKLLTLLAAAATTLTVLPGHHVDAATLAGRNVKIGCLVPLTGKGAEWGQGAKPSIDIAVEEINAKGGIGGLPIEMICYDDQTLESEALNAMNRLVDRSSIRALRPQSIRIARQSPACRP